MVLGRVGTPCPPSVGKISQPAGQRFGTHITDTQINVILSAAKDRFACEDGCTSLKSLHVA